jgi:NAD(P)-dependent dehydrogenase (short-subunit alcohol dehydrogenase family)
MNERTVSPVAVVTGASQGLGLAVARELAARGWQLVLDARRSDRLSVAERELSSTTPVVAIAGDVSDREHRRQLHDAARRSGPVRLVVNNASTLGASPLPRLDDADEDVLRRTFDVNVVAPLSLVRDLRDVLSGDAVIVNVTSDAAVEPYEGWGVYGASKAALEHASRVLAAERPDLRVLVVDPGDMRTEMHQDAFPGEDISDRPPPDGSAAAIVALIERNTPSGRYAVRDLESASS